MGWRPPLPPLGWLQGLASVTQTCVNKMLNIASSETISRDHQVLWRWQGAVCTPLLITDTGDATGHSTPQQSRAQHSKAQHSTAQHSTAQHSTAQHSTAQYCCTQQEASPPPKHTVADTAADAAAYLASNEYKIDKMIDGYLALHEKAQQKAIREQTEQRFPLATSATRKYLTKDIGLLLGPARSSRRVGADVGGALPAGCSMLAAALQPVRDMGQCLACCCSHPPGTRGLQPHDAGNLPQARQAWADDTPPTAPVEMHHLTARVCACTGFAAGASRAHPAHRTQAAEHAAGDV